MKKTALELKDISKYYEKQLLLDGISFSVLKDETVCLLGPSGSGKSTLLRIIAGLEQPESGRVFWEGEDITAKPPHQRNFSLMFQDYALFPHLTVSENIAFGLRMKKMPLEEVHPLVNESLALVRMQKFANRRVTDLSGGEQQRVALARALAPQPQLLMLDEPLGALDRTLREHLMAELRALLQEIDIPVIYVTHDQQEAFSIADRLIVLHDAHLLQSGPPAEVYARPASPWLARFFGFDNLLEGQVVEIDPLSVATPIGQIHSTCALEDVQPGQGVELVLKPDALVLDKSSISQKYDGTVLESIFAGNRYQVTVGLDGQHRYVFEIDQSLKAGERIQFSLNPSSILCYTGKV